MLLRVLEALTSAGVVQSLTLEPDGLGLNPGT